MVLYVLDYRDAFSLIFFLFIFQLTDFAVTLEMRMLKQITGAMILPRTHGVELAAMQEVNGNFADSVALDVFQVVLRRSKLKTGLFLSIKKLNYASFFSIKYLHCKFEQQILFVVLK